MTYLKTIIDTVQIWLEDEGDEADVIFAINRAIRKVEKVRDWETLKDTVSVTPDSSGVILQPAASRVIRRVYPVGSYDLPEYRFYPKAELDQLDKPKTSAYKLLSYPSVKTQLSDILLVDAVQGSQTVIQATASTDDVEVAWIGERFQIEGDETLYEIIDATADTSMTVFPAIRRETGNAQIAKVRPLGMEQYQLMDHTGVAFTAAVDIMYQIKHPTLINYTDHLLIPAEDTVTLEAIKFFLHQTKYDVDARQLAIDLKEAKMIECNQEATASPEHVGAQSTFSIRSKRGNHTLR